MPQTVISAILLRNNQLGVTNTAKLFHSFIRSQKAAGLDNLNFIFADNLIDSSCQGNLTSPSMESPRMYEEGAPDVLKDFSRKAVFSFSTGVDEGLNTLDPTLENVIDLQELINTTIPALESEEGPLTIDTIFPASDLDLLDSKRQENSTKDNFESTEHMTNAEEIAVPSTGTASRQIVTIKCEDLNLTACQAGTEAIGSLNIPESHYDSSSSRCSSPEKSPVVYECRKPGRKPSAGGPIRCRKKEPPRNTPEYYEKRARNNIAVRKSREKAKLRQNETEGRVGELSAENERLQRKVDLLTKELTVLKSLFINAGASVPDNFEEILSR